VNPSFRRLLPPMLAFVVLALVGGPVLAAGPLAEARAGHLTGIDVSHWQGTIGWRKVKAAGIEFVIAKATEAQWFVDPQYARNRERADALGVRFGAYHFAQPDRTRNDAVREADHFVKAAQLRGRHLQPVLDLERHGGLGHRALVRWTKAWLQRVESRLGVKPMIYSSPSFWTERMGNSSWFASNGYRMWVAHWWADQPRVPADNWAGIGWSLWQVTNCGHVPGIGGCVDVDLSRSTDITPLLIRRHRAG
jgi:lysozyme